jgi:hypothetical protein
MKMYTINVAAIEEIKWRGNAVFDTGNIILMYGGKETNTFGTGFLINSKYIQAIMNVEAVDE